MFAPNISGAITLLFILFLMLAVAYWLIQSAVQWFVERQLLDEDARLSFISIALRALWSQPMALLAYSGLSSSLDSGLWPEHPVRTVLKLFLFVSLATVLQWVACWVSDKERSLAPSIVAVFFAVSLGLAIVIGPLLVRALLGAEL